MALQNALKKQAQSSDSHKMRVIRAQERLMLEKINLN